MMEGEVDELKESLSIEDRLAQSCTTPSNAPKLAGKTKVRGTVIETSAKAQVSATTYRKANEIIEQNPSEELLNKLRLGKISIPKAYRQLENQKKRQDLLSKDANSNVQFSENIRLFLGDFIEKCKDIPANSIKLIYTDPPYALKFLPIYDELAKAADRLLEDDGSLVTYCAQNLKCEVIQIMKSRGLVPWWEIPIFHNGSSARMFTKKVIVTWKPLLWFAKGTEPKIFEFIEDSVDSQRPNKTLHRWTQSIDEAMHVISKLTRENETVLDPMMGTGTTGIAALNQNRRFIGIEKNADTFRLARHRISKIISSKQNSPTGEELPS
jgi:16S rRNA G966 N2-methylase RsmD